MSVRGWLKPPKTKADRRFEILDARLIDVQGKLIRLADTANKFTNLVKESFMGLKEDFATLQGKFDGMESAVVAVADDIAALKSEIAEANDRANIDLGPLVARAEGIEAGLRAAVGAGPGSDPEAPPAEPPA